MYRVLIIDDELPFIHSLMRFEWQRYDCCCVGSAQNGQDGLAACAKLMPHIVITDINMPIMDGLSLMQALKEQYPEIQIILLTVHKSFEYAQKAVSLGATDYLVKDMTFRESLPQVLAKAKSAFEQTSFPLNRRAKLLHRSGRLILLSSMEALAANQEEMESFLKQFGGVLVTVKLNHAELNQHGLIAQLDSFLGRSMGNIGLIVHDSGCFEIMTTRTLSSTAGWLKDLFGSEVPPFDGKNQQHMVIAKDVTTLAQYQIAHQQNLRSLEWAFYMPQPVIQTEQGPPFQIMKSQTLESWLRRIELIGASAKELEAYLKEEVLPHIQREHNEPDQVRSAFERFLHQYEARYASKMDDEAHTALLSAETLNQLMSIFMEAVKKLLSSHGGYSYPIGEAVSYIMQHLDKPALQLFDVAGHVHISPGYLSKKLKEETGQSFQEMLIRIRMEAAAAMLKAGDKKVYEIAEAVGYINYRSFASAFDNYYGVNPKKYR